MTIETLTDEDRRILETYDFRILTKALRIIDAHAADRAALVEQLVAMKARAEAAERRVAELGSGTEACLNCSYPFREKAESECAALRQANDCLQQNANNAVEECAALRAEVKRCAVLDARADRNRAEAQLAAANALLKRAEPLCNAPRMGNEQVREDIRAHLSGQPAAQSEGRCVKCWCDECQCQPAAPTRTAAEQRVLDAWAAVDTDTLHMWATHPSEHVRNTCRAELARREAADAAAQVRARRNGVK